MAVVRREPKTSAAPAARTRSGDLGAVASSTRSRAIEKTLRG